MEWFEKPSQETFHTPTATPEATGFWDNGNAAFAEMRRENLPIISEAQNSETMDYRRSILNKHYAEGRIPDSAFEFFQTQTGFDIDGLSMYARNELGLTDVMTPEEYKKTRNEEYADLRKKETEVYEAQNKWGILGEFGGRMAAIPTDPLYATSFFTGYGAATTALQAAIRVSAMEMAIEGVAQFPIASFKEELGVDYGASQMLVNTLAAGAFGFIGGGATKLIEKRFAKMLPEEMTVSDAIERMTALSGVMGNDTTAPIIRVLQQSDPNAKAIDILVNDENMTIATNNVGAKTGTDPRADIDTSHVDEAVEEYDAMKAAAETAAKEAEAAKATDEGVPRGTPAPEPVKATYVQMKEEIAAKADDLKQTRLAEAEAQKAKDDKLVDQLEKRKANPKLFPSEVRDIEARIERVKKRSAEWEADRKRVAEKGDYDASPLSYMIRKMDQLSEDIDKLSKGEPISQLSKDDWDWLRKNPATRGYMERLDELSKGIDALESGKGVPRGTPPPVSVVPDDAHPLVKTAYNNVAEIDAKLQQLEEVC